MKCGEALPAIAPAPPAAESGPVAIPAMPVSPEAPPSARPKLGKGARTFLGAGVVLAIVAALLGGAFLLLSGFPHGDRDQTKHPVKPPMETVQEGQATAFPPGLINDAPPVEAATPAPSRSPAPPSESTQPPPAASRRIEIHPTVPPRPAAGPPTPRSAEPASANAEPDGALTEAQAINRLAEFIRSSSYYGNAVRCLEIRSAGYKNRGYTLAVSGRECDGAAAGIDDRWRVDTVTREVFKQRNGHFLRP